MRRNRTWRRRPPHSVLVVDSGATSFYVIVTYILVHVQFYIDVGGAERGADDASSSESREHFRSRVPPGSGVWGQTRPKTGDNGQNAGHSSPAGHC